MSRIRWRPGSSSRSRPSPPAAAFTETRILDKRYLFEDLLAAFLLRLKDHAGAQLNDLPPRIVVGRPVTFAGGSPNEALALTRYEEAFKRLGFDRHPLRLRAGRRGVLLRPPAEAGRHRAGRRLRRRHQRLLDRAVRARRRQACCAPRPCRARASASPATPSTTGSSTSWCRRSWARAAEYKSFDKQAADPAALLRRLRALGSAGPAARLQGHARHPRPGAHGRGARKDRRLIEVLDDNHGYALYKSVSALKEALSSQTEATFRFEAGSVHIEKPVARAGLRGLDRPGAGRHRDRRRPGAGTRRAWPGRRRPCLPDRRQLVRAGRARYLPAPLRGREDRERRRVRVDRLGPGPDRARNGPGSVDHAGGRRRSLSPDDTVKVSPTLSTLLYGTDIPLVAWSR
jgi:hypothetical protein